MVEVPESHVVRRGTNRVWFVLMAVTALGCWLGHTGQQGAGSGPQCAPAGVLLLAFIKVWLVGFQFMELRSAPGWLRLAFDGWALAVPLVLIWII